MAVRRDPVAGATVSRMGLDARFLERARRLIAADTVSDHGNLAALPVLEEACAEAGLASRRQPSFDTPDRDANLLAGPGGGDGAGDPLLLVTHTDTVAPGPRELWRTDPFSLVVDGTRAYGLGTADVKLDALCKLEAARRLRGVRLARPFWFLGTYGEEVGLRGAKAFIAALPFRPAFVLCGEPSELRFVTAHKGYAVVVVRLSSDGLARVDATGARRLVFDGKAAHSSTPQLGINAVDRALDALAVDGAPAVLDIAGGVSTNTIPARCEALVVDTPRPGNSVDLAPLLVRARVVEQAWNQLVAAALPASDATFAPATAVSNLTRLRHVGDGLELTFDARLLPKHDGDQILDAFAQALATIPGASLASRRYAAGMGLAADSTLARVAAQVLATHGLDPTPISKPTSTEGGVFFHAGIEAAVFGPSVSTGNAHTANENALLDQVERAIDVYEGLIRALCA